jgi:NAD(P)H-nitrite reductase large subunit
VLRGPEYARRCVEAARTAGVELRTGATVTGWAAPLRAEVTSPAGRVVVGARAVVLATGARERPRSARRVPGDRPDGVLTTGQLQNLVHLGRARPGSRAVVVGAELVSWSAVLTLRAAGARTVVLTSEHAVPESPAAVTAAGRLGLGVPVARRTRVARILGRSRVEAVELEHLDTGARRTLPCDTVVFTGDWIPDHELARLAGVTIDPGTRGPLVDPALRTSAPGLFAVGNLVHPVDTADVAALDGRAVVPAVLAHLAGTAGAGAAGVRIRPGDGLRWVSPGLLDAAGTPPPLARLLAWPDRTIPRPVVTVRQGDRILTARRLRPTASPGRVLGIPFGLLAGVDHDGTDVTVALD